MFAYGCVPLSAGRDVASLAALGPTDQSQAGSWRGMDYMDKQGPANEIVKCKRHIRKELLNGKIAESTLLYLGPTASGHRPRS